MQEPLISNGFREIADEVGAYLMVDMAHIAGLVAAGRASKPDSLCPCDDNHHPQDTYGDQEAA